MRSFLDHAEALLCPFVSRLGTMFQSLKYMAGLEPQKVTRRCLYFFRHPKLLIGRTFWVASLLVISLISIEKMHEALQCDLDEVYSAMATAYWRWETDNGVNATTRSTTSMRIVYTFARYVFFSAPDYNVLIVYHAL